MTTLPSRRYAIWKVEEKVASRYPLIKVDLDDKFPTQSKRIEVIEVGKHISTKSSTISFLDSRLCGTR